MDGTILSRRRAFTLIELLVVIAIIGILAGLLFPVFLRAREAARKTQCLANVKNVAIAIQMYLSDYDRFPPNEHRPEVIRFFRSIKPDCLTRNITFSNPYLRWPVVLDEYLKNRDVWHCPSARLRDTIRITPGPDWFAVYLHHPDEVASYAGSCNPNYPPGWGGHITDSWSQGAPAYGRQEPGDAQAFVPGISTNGNAYDVSTGEIDDPAKYVVCCDAGGRQEPTDTSMGVAYPDLCRLGCASCPDHAGKWQPCAFSEPCGAGDPQYGTDPEFRKEHSPARHMGGDNLGFADGHVKWMPAEEILWGGEDHREYIPENQRRRNAPLQGIWLCRLQGAR